MAAGLWDVRIRGLREVQRELSRLGANASRELKAGSRSIAKDFAGLVKAAGQADSRQSARAARTVRAVSAGGDAGVRAGPHPLLYLSEFGMNRHTGWYAKPRYARSEAGNATHRHVGQHSYWFFKAIEDNRDHVEAELARVGDRIIGDWNA